MNDKERILDELRGALGSGLISDNEVRALLTPVPTVIVSSKPTQASPPLDAPQKLSAVEVMFDVAGIVLFVAIMSMIVQSWDSHNVLEHVLLSAGVGAGLWWIAYYLFTQKLTTDLRKGLENSLVLTGSLCMIAGGFIIATLLTGGYDSTDTNVFAISVALAALGFVHLAYDRLVRKDLIFLLGILLVVATFPTLLVAILKDSNPAPDVWSVISISSLLLLAYAARVMTRIDPARRHLRRAYDSLVAFLCLLTMFVSSFDSAGLIWLALMIASVFGLFYISIVMRNKHLLGNASLFLVIAVITISFKYFSGAGASVSLIIAAAGLLGSAAIATSINKKYFKAPTERLLY